MSLASTTVNTFLRRVVKSRQDPAAPVARVRGLADLFRRLFPSPPSSTRLEERVLGGRPATVVRAAGARADRAILYLHGGGYCSGSPAMYLDLAHRLSTASGVTVLLPDYRLAPEHPFPAAVDDALAAYRDALRDRPPSHLAIAGDSAGGGLTFATLVAARDAGLPMPAAAWAISPWTDLAYTGESHRRNRDADAFIRADLVGAAAGWYVGDAPRESPLASPLYAALHALPPMLVHVGSTEILLDDSRRIVARLREAGVETTLTIFDDLPHVFHVFAAYLPEARAAIVEGGRFLAARLGA